MPGFELGLVSLGEHKAIARNGHPGFLIRSRVRRKLLEVLFDGRPEADAPLNADAKSFYTDLAADRGLGSYECSRLLSTNQTLSMIPNRKSVVKPNNSHPFNASSAPRRCQWSSKRKFVCP